MPKPPQIGYEEAKSVWKPPYHRKRYPQPPEPSKCAPTHAASNPALETNLFVRILAAKPKMDLSTRNILPSPLLTKVGVTESIQIGPVPQSNNRLLGPRAYLSAISSQLPKGFSNRLFIKHPELRDTPLAPDYLGLSRQVLVDEIRRSLFHAEQSTDKTPICSLKPGTSIYYLDISAIPTDPPLPELPTIIRGGTAGVHLATLLFKYNFIEQWRKADRK